MKKSCSTSVPIQANTFARMNTFFAVELLSASSQSQTTHVGILYRISFLHTSIMPFTKKLFSSRSFFNERMLFFSIPCNNHWLFHVNDWTSLPTSRSNYHMSTLRYDEPQQIFLYFCNWSFKYSNYENEEFLNVLNRIASMYGLLRYWRTYKFSS